MNFTNTAAVTLYTRALCGGLNEVLDDYHDIIVQVFSDVDAPTHMQALKFTSNSYMSAGRANLSQGRGYSCVTHIPQNPRGGCSHGGCFHAHVKARILRAQYEFLFKKLSATMERVEADGLKG